MADKATVHYIDVDTTDADKALKQLEEHSRFVEAETMVVLRKTYSSMVLMADMMNIAIPQWFNLMISASLMIAETYTALAAAETLTIVGALKATMTFTAATIMFAQAINLMMYKSEAENKLNTIVQLLNIWS